MGHRAVGAARTGHWVFGALAKGLRVSWGGGRCSWPRPAAGTVWMWKQSGDFCLDLSSGQGLGHLGLQWCETRGDAPPRQSWGAARARLTWEPPVSGR